MSSQFVVLLLLDYTHIHTSETYSPASQVIVGAGPLSQKYAESVLILSGSQGVCLTVDYVAQLWNQGHQKFGDATHQQYTYFDICLY